VACGELGCLAFESPEAAFIRVLQDEPRVLAIGETHAQRTPGGAPDARAESSVPTATARFRGALLPLLATRATDLLLELWVSSGQCGKPERLVRKAQGEVTRGQASTNRDEFVELARAAKSLGVQPHVLVPSCAEYDVIARSGAEDISRMLEIIADRTARDVQALLRSPGPDAAARRLIVVYGGALHNDVVPRPGREAWSFGPRLVRHTSGKYVELDLIVREFIKDTESWRAQPWHRFFDARRHAGKAVLFQPAPQSYALIFP
jgi:hypothetical protein